MNVLLITTYNRPEYLAECFKSLKEANIPRDVTIVIVDDFSQDARTLELIQKFSVAGVKCFKLFKNVNEGIRSSLKYGYDFSWNLGAKNVINLDGDAIVKKDFIQKIITLKEQFPENVISGFNSKNKNKDGSLRNPIIEEKDTFILKKYANGINMCINKSQYDSYVLPALLKVGNWNFNTSSADPKPVIVTRPSVVQHIGINSSMGHNEDPDVACDFKDLYLPQVTLFGTDCRDPKGMLRAAEISCRNIDFGKVKIITEPCLFNGRKEYSKFYIKELTNYIDTEYVLIIHTDGYVINPSAWSDEFLEYDYIGATWAYKDNMNVGNGGFSLRSKKLLDILSKLDLEEYHPEDDIICRKLRPMLESKYGIRFASEEIANRFSIEAYGSAVFNGGNKYSGQFGFHSVHIDYSESNLPKEILYIKEKEHKVAEPIVPIVDRRSTRKNVYRRY